MDTPKNQVDHTAGNNNNLCHLPEDVLTKILTSHVDAKVVLRISLASKQFASLVVSHIDSLAFDYIPTPGYRANLDQIIAGLFNRFPKLQHLHIVTLSLYQPRNNKTLAEGFCQASIGCEFELGYILFGKLHHQTLIDRDYCQLPSSAGIWSLTTDDPRISSLPEADQQLGKELRYARDEQIVKLLQLRLRAVPSDSRFIRRIVSRNTKLKSITMCDPIKSLMVHMGEEEIARSRLKHRPNPVDIDTLMEVTLWEVPLLNLPTLGCALTDVELFLVKPAAKPSIQQPGVLQKCVWSNYDKDWTIFRVAVKDILLNDDLKKKKLSFAVQDVLQFGILDPLLMEHYYKSKPSPHNQIEERGNEAEDGNHNALAFNPDH